MKLEDIKIAIVDGQGGGLGRSLMERIRQAYPNLHVRALGTNSLATTAMIKAGATDGATGENAIVYNASHMQIILGPVAIVASNGLLGEVTPSMASAIGSSDAVKILIPSKKCNLHLAVGPWQPMQIYLESAINQLQEELDRLCCNIAL